MNIYITLNNNNNEASIGIPEMVLIEFQGDIECPNDDFQGQLLTQLQARPNPTGNGIKYSIDIGIHHIEGEVKKMDKMLLVTKNKVISQEEARMEVVGICKEKIVFNKRPTPVLRQELKKVKLTTEITDIKV